MIILRIVGTGFGIIALYFIFRLTVISMLMSEGFKFPIWMDVTGLIVTVILCCGLWWLSVRKGTQILKKELQKLQ
jgi:protein-S-isoprenylcysteine O-methyltransferase Ste14